MAKLTKKQFEEVFREEVLPYVIERERAGFPDKPARREAWNNTVDSYIRDRQLPEAAGNWAHPRWLETWGSKRTDDHAKKKKGQLDVLGGYRVDLDRGGQLLREKIDLTTPGDYGADPLGDGTFRMVPSGDIVDFAERTRRLDARRAGRSHARKKSPAQLDREIAEALSRPINKRKRVRHFSETTDKKGGTQYYVTYEDLTGHGITREELARYRQHEQGRAGRAHSTKAADRPLIESIQAGDRVTIVDRFGTERTGRAVMRGPHGWVLNMGGRHGTPGIASADNVTRVRCGKK